MNDNNSNSIPHYNPESANTHLDFNKPIKKILYSIVMHEESQILIETFNLKKDEEFSRSHSNLLESYIKYDDKNNLDIILVRPLIDPFNKTELFGTEISFLISYLAIQFYKPDIIISFGYAGSTGINKSLKLGDIVLAKDCGFYFRRNMIIEFYQKTSMGLYPLFNCENTSKQLNFPLSIIGSSNSFVSHDDIATSKGVEVVEMELCSVARAAYYFKIPCVGLKIISDTSSNDELTDQKEREKQFLESLKIMRQNLVQGFSILNDFISGKVLNQL